VTTGILRTFAGIVLAFAAGLACAQYPDKPIRLILPFAPGQGTDIASRAVMAEVAKRIGQPIVIDNRPGGAGMIAIQAVQHAAPDGYTVLGFSSSFLANGSLQKAPLPYNLQRDFIPVARTVDSAVVLVANPEVPVKTVADVVALARRDPANLAFGSAGIATTMHLSLEIFKMRSGLPLVHVPYKGDPPALADVMGGQLKYTFAGFAAALPHIRSGKVRPIAVTTSVRIPQLPDIPTFAESYPSFEMVGWLGYMVPVGTPAAVVEKLHKAIRGAVEDAEVRERMAGLGMMVAQPQKPDEFRKYMFDTQQRMEEGIRSANIQPQ